MNPVHLHLLLNHIPLLFPVAALLVLIFSWMAGSEAVRRAGYLLLIVGAAGAGAAIASGDRAEDAVEQLAGISEQDVERHEQAAETFAWMAYVLGALAIAGLFISHFRKSWSDMAAAAILLLTVITFYFAWQAGHSGGMIRHPEIRKTADNTSNTPNTSGLKDDSESDEEQLPLPHREPD